MLERFTGGNKIVRSAAAISLAGGLALGLSSCTSSEASDCASDEWRDAAVCKAEATTKAVQSGEAKLNGYDVKPTVERSFTSDGQMITRISDQADATMGNPTYILSSCNGNDLVDTILRGTDGWNGQVGGSVERSPNHPACTDGRLDPSDFEIPSSPAPTPTPTN